MDRKRAPAGARFLLMRAGDMHHYQRMQIISSDHLPKQDDLLVIPLLPVITGSPAPK